MAETESDIKNAAIQAYNEAQIGGYLLTPYGDLSTYFKYVPKFRQIKIRKLATDAEGNPITDPETGAYAWVGSPEDYDMPDGVEIEEETLPVKNFLSMGLTSSILTPEEKNYLRRLIKAAATQIELMRYYIENEKFDMVLEKSRLVDKLYAMCADVADTSKGADGETMHIVKTRFEHSLSDIRQRQELREEKEKGILGGFKNPLKRKGKREMRML